ncbi:MAG: nucleotidyltransferase domain-containing protein [Deltaproteobacteria bacterium]|nr:nucleotidyltransferase domain-containing protein [Deltaproteobacteria bacterium]
MADGKDRKIVHEIISRYVERMREQNLDIWRLYLYGSYAKETHHEDSDIDLTVFFNKDDIACWFIDTDCNGESFFVRHAYFTGADRPYEKLKRALRAEVEEGAWASLYSTRSLPFDPPTTGKIAVKVINHYGDEVLKVYEIRRT